MKKLFRVRNVFLILIVMFVVANVEYARYINSFCSDGGRPIQSKTDAITVAKRRIVKNRFFSSDRFGSALDFVNALDQDCCDATRSPSIFGLIVWEVDIRTTTPPVPVPDPYLSGGIKMIKRTVRSVHVEMSNCGEIFVGDSYKHKLMD